jgi:hypothetical protein
LRQKREACRYQNKRPPWLEHLKDGHAPAMVAGVAQ